jgi:hypothetical protein
MSPLPTMSFYARPMPVTVNIAKKLNLNYGAENSRVKSTDYRLGNDRFNPTTTLI